MWDLCMCNLRMCKEDESIGSDEWMPGTVNFCDSRECLILSVCGWWLLQHWSQIMRASCPSAHGSLFYVCFVRCI
jgi:hypothetical protein